MKTTLSHNPDKYISRTGRNVPPSGIREFFDIVYTRPDCISLGVGEPDFDTPWRISDCGIYSIKDGYTHYTPNRGLPVLRDLTSKYLKEKYNISYDAGKELIITMGVSQGLDLALRSIINPGDEVIIFEPCYVSYRANIEMLHGVAMPVDTLFSEDFEISLERMEKAITPKTKAILLNYPSNPTGKSISKEKLEAISEIAIRHDLLILSDEIYSAITYTGKHTSIVTIPGMKERTIYLNGFSKSHAMTGWRLGFVAGPEYLISVMLKIHQYTALCAPSMAQHAAIEALENGDREVQADDHRVHAPQELYRKPLQRLPAFPATCRTGPSMFSPTSPPTGLKSKDFALKLLDAKGVAVVPGNAFGSAGEGYIRCSYATSMENIREALNRIEAFVRERPWGLLIDGFNLIYKFPELEELMYQNRLNEARKGLQEILKEYHAIKPAEIRIVYDGKRNQGDQLLQETIGPLRVYYSHDFSADHLIKQFIKHEMNPKMTTVVTSDKEIIFFINRFHCPHIKSEDFSVMVRDAIIQHNTVKNPEKEPDPELSDEDIAYWENMFKKGH